MLDSKNSNKIPLGFGIFFIFVMVVFWFEFNFPKQTTDVFLKIGSLSNQLASVVLGHKPKTVAEIKSNYNNEESKKGNQKNNEKIKQKKVRILLVPGHEPNYGGTEYKNYKERDLVLEIASNLEKFLKANPDYEVYMTRDGDTWRPEFGNYFTNNWEDIVEWTKLADKANAIEIPESEVFHNTAREDVALRLHGVTKWANENNVDIVMHIHLNDYPRKNVSTPGKYAGFAIYVPSYHFDNSASTKAVAESIKNRLSKYSAVSDLPGESLGVVDESELIAIGSKNNSNAVSMLIEYGYIYEPQFSNITLRSIALRDLAFQTYLGLEDFFDPELALKSASSTSTLIPREWSDSLISKTPTGLDVFALQTVLMQEGVYPPEGKTKRDCPRTGILGPCTKEALKDFQKKHDIGDKSGVLGTKTLEYLKANY